VARKNQGQLSRALHPDKNPDNPDAGAEKIWWFRFCWGGGSPAEGLEKASYFHGAARGGTNLHQFFSGETPPLLD